METLQLQPQALNKKKNVGYSFNPFSSLDNALTAIFPENIQESKLLGTKRKLGEKAKTLTDEQIECLITDFQYLVDTWLDEFEKDVFEGQTLQELLGEKAYANSQQERRH